MANIDAAIDEAERQLEPAGLEDIAVAIDRLLTFARTFAIQTDRSGLTEIYRDGCKGMPRRALTEGLPEVLAQSRDTFRLPMPGAVWDIVRDKIGRWESEVLALKNVRGMMLNWDRPRLAEVARAEPPATAEYCAETRRIVEQTLASLKSHSKQHGRIA